MSDSWTICLCLALDWRPPLPQGSCGITVKGNENWGKSQSVLGASSSYLWVPNWPCSPRLCILLPFLLACAVTSSCSVRQETIHLQRLTSQNPTAALSQISRTNCNLCLSVCLSPHTCTWWADTQTHTPLLWLCPDTNNIWGSFNLYYSN